MMTKSTAEHSQKRWTSLGLSAPRLTALREELASLQNALRSIQPRVDATALRLMRQFHAQLASTSAVVSLVGTPGAGVSTLIRLLSGDLGDAPQRDGTASTISTPTVLPVRLTDTKVGQTHENNRRSIAERMAENTLNLVVLRADRLKGAVDLGLVRLLREGAKHPMILFVNHVDLLDDPASEIGSIRTMLQALVGRHHSGPLPPIVFGSLSWAEAAQTGRLSALSEDSKEALLSLAEVADVDGDDHPPSFVWKLSGLPDLIEAIGAVLDESPLRRMLGNIRRHLQVALADLGGDAALADAGLNAAGTVALTLDDVGRRAEALSQRLMADLDRQSALIVDQVRARIARVGNDYAESAVADMLLRFDRVDAPLQWEMDPFRAKLQLRSACLGFAQSCRALTDRMLRRGARDFAALSRELLGTDASLPAPESALGTFMSIRAPEPKGTGHGDKWSWRPRSGHIKLARVREFRSHINLQVAILLRDAEERQINAPMEAMRKRLADFLRDQSKALITLAGDGSCLRGNAGFPLSQSRPADAVKAVPEPAHPEIGER
jgi:hypothetical protein